MSDIPESERAAFERAKTLAQYVPEMASRASNGSLALILDIETLIQLNLRWQAGGHQAQSIGPLLRIARQIGLESLLHIHGLLSPYSASPYTVTAKQRPPSQKPRSDDRTPRRYQQAQEAHARRNESWAKFQRTLFGERVQELRSQDVKKTPAILEAGREYFPSYKKRWLQNQFKQFEAEAIRQNFVGSDHPFSLLSSVAPRHSLASLPGKRGRPKK